MSGHQLPNRGLSVDWQTPPEILSALCPFHDDPCLPLRQDGLTKPWKGLVWCNPPYDRNIGKWLEKCANHGNAIALIFARTETKHFHQFVWERANCVFFFKGRLHFYRDGKRSKLNAGAPSVLVGYGPLAVQRIESSKLLGKLVYLDRPVPLA